MNFNYKSFKDELFSQNNGEYSHDEIDSILDLDVPYDERDTPISTGKRLIVTNIEFSGVKSNGENIQFSQQINQGINIWIADNLTGKSSLFKIIKLALTGDNDLKRDVKNWITHILVCFLINDKPYSVYLDRSERTLKAKLYSQKIDSLIGLDEIKIEPLFSASSESEFQKQMQQFFFTQFSYYSLKWTQKASQKSSDKLLDANTSWVTYFKSIFLESKDSDKLTYGDQGTKIFQMLLGLQLTYPINRLSIKKDRLEFDRSKVINDFNNPSSSINRQKKTDLSKELSEINHELRIIERVDNQAVNMRSLYQEYDSIIERINSEHSIKYKLQNDIQNLEFELQTVNKNIQITNYEYERIKKGKNKNLKLLNDINEYLEIGRFFSNLDIKHCPNCNHQISERNKENELRNRECSICHEKIDENLSSSENYQNKIKSLSIANQRYLIDEENLINELSNLKSTKGTLISDIEQKKEDINQLQNIDNLQEQLNNIENEINKEKRKTTPNEKRKAELISRKAVIEFQLLESKKSEEKNSIELYDRKIKLISMAINKLIEMRYELGKSILENLSNLMLSTINELGLDSITHVKINDYFKITYEQDKEYVNFSEIAEGEQLRIKIAFYLSLIQLDIDHNFGRHTRFLIIDSPSKEEGDAKYIEGFTHILRLIESKFGNKLQILIGTAERELSNQIKNEIVVPQGEFLF